MKLVSEAVVNQSKFKQTSWPFYCHGEVSVSQRIFIPPDLSLKRSQSKEANISNEKVNRAIHSRYRSCWVCEIGLALPARKGKLSTPYFAIGEVSLINAKRPISGMDL